MATTRERGEAGYPSPYTGIPLTSSRASGEESEGSGSASEEEHPAKRRGRLCGRGRGVIMAIAGVPFLMLLAVILFFVFHSSSSEDSPNDEPSSDAMSASESVRCFPVMEAPPIQQEDGSFIVRVTTTPPPVDVGAATRRLDSQDEGVIDDMESMFHEVVSTMPPPAPTSLPAEAENPLQQVAGSQPFSGTTTATTCIPVSMLPANSVELTGHCATNPQDHEIWLHGGGAQDFTGVISECAHSCWGRSDCVRDCVSKKDGYSKDCAQCFGDLASCTAMHCLFNCVAGGESCNVCVNDNCNPTFWKCSGLEEGALVQAMVEMKSQWLHAHPEEAEAQQQSRRLGSSLAAAAMASD